MDVRPARADELPAVMTVLDGALLETDAAAVQAAVGDGRVLVAVEDGPVLGAVVLEDDLPTDGARIEAVAVRPGRRGQGLGTALARAAAAEYGRLAAEFDVDVRPFWISLGFDVEPADEPDRYVGTLDADRDVDVDGTAP